MEAVLTRLKALEERLAALEARLVILESYHQITDRWFPYKREPSQRDCGCPVNTIFCNSTACPRAVRVTYAVSTKEIEN